MSPYTEPKSSTLMLKVELPSQEPICAVGSQPLAASQREVPIGRSVVTSSRLLAMYCPLREIDSPSPVLGTLIATGPVAAVQRNTGPPRPKSPTPTLPSPERPRTLVP